MTLVNFAGVLDVAKISKEAEKTEGSRKSESNGKFATLIRFLRLP
jgi:hypothetical protein